MELTKITFENIRRPIVYVTIVYITIVYVTVENSAFCLFLYLPGVHFCGELQHVGDVNEQKIKCSPIKTPEIGGVRL